MMFVRPMKFLFALFLFALWVIGLACLTHGARAQQNVVINCVTGYTSTNAPIYAPASASNPCPTTVIGGTSSTPLTPAAINPSSNLTLAAANTSQTLAAANACPNFLYINNAVEASNEGIATAEPIFVNIQGGTAASGGGGSSIEIAPGVIQPFVAQTTAVTWVAATIGHKIGAVCE